MGLEGRRMRCLSCQQCGGLLTGYYQFSVCSPCYSKNVAEAQRKLLGQEKRK